MTDKASRSGQTSLFDVDALDPVSAPAPPPPEPPPPEPPPPPAPPAPKPEPPKKEEPHVFSVGQLGRVLSKSLERVFPDAVWVEGEISGARPASSGHLYFCLKDEEEEAVVDVVMYRMQISPRARTLVRDGARVKVRARPTFWSPRGKMQLIADRIEPTGKGALLEALEKLKAKLAGEGLFKAERKRKLPAEPRIVGVVTSKAGAVIHDVWKVAFRRGGAHILLAPATVQGLGAAESVRRSLAALQRIPEVDVIIVGRGGGSQDDLLAFHDEQLVRDVAACRVPVVSAVGHETDVTLVDFAADARAATPSQAAEMVVPDAVARRRLLEERQHRVHRAMHARIAEERARVAHLAVAFRDPRLLIASAQQRVDDSVARMTRVLQRAVARDRETVARLAARLGAAHPRERIAKDAGRLVQLDARLAELTRSRLIARSSELARLDVRLRRSTTMVTSARNKLGALAGRLDAMSPLAVLSRGYAIATRTSDGHAIRDASEVNVGDTLHVRVARGSFEAAVTTTNADDGRDAREEEEKP